MPTIPANYRALAGSRRTPRKGALRTADASPDEQIDVSLRLRRRPDAPALPDPARAKPGAATLSREDFAARYGASAVDLDQVAAFATGAGLAVVERSVARRTVVVRGTVAQMNAAFGVDLGIYKTAAETYRGRDGEIHVPTAIHDIVEGVFGLDNRRMAEPMLRFSGRTPADNAPAQATVPMTPQAVAQLYGFPATGAAGQTIGIFEFGGGYLASDLQLFFSSVQAPVPSVTPVSILGQENNPGSDSYTTETLLDIGVSGAAAQGARLAVYFAPWTEQGWVDIVTTAIHDTVNRPSVISISYGWPENDTINGLTWSLAAIQAVNTTFQEAAAMGVSVFVSSGDNGSGCGVGDGKAHVLYPGSDPMVTCAGGTTLSNVSGSSFTEDVWNDNGVTGGGISDIFCPPNFALPVWQAGANVPGSVNDGHAGRGIPDIAGNADPDSGYTLFQNGSNIGAVGGTSATAPLYAALAAVLNAKLGRPVGYLNPTLYTAPFRSVFRDVNDGRSNASGGAAGYTAGPNWDACTGWGSMNGTTLLNLLAPAPAEGTLGFIKTTNTPNGHVEVHLASGCSGFQTRILETATTFADESDGTWQFLSNLDLGFIKTANTPSGRVEVHVASRSSNYQTRTLEAATSFANETDGVWGLLPNLDLVFVKTANTPNGHVEVHIASRSSNYQTRTLETATTFANETDGTWQILANQDLAFIKTANTPSGHVEVHIASRSSNYQTRTLETATTFANETDGTWQLLPNLDLVFVKTANTPSGQVEVHIASKSSNYQTRIVETPTTFAEEQDGVWSLVLA